MTEQVQTRNGQSEIIFPEYTARPERAEAELWLDELLVDLMLEKFINIHFCKEDKSD